MVGLPGIALLRLSSLHLRLQQVQRGTCQLTMLHCSSRFGCKRRAERDLLKYLEAECPIPERSVTVLDVRRGRLAALPDLLTHRRLRLIQLARFHFEKQTSNLAPGSQPFFFC